jgi:hypothetical protein
MSPCAASPSTRTGVPDVLTSLRPSELAASGPSTSVFPAQAHTRTMGTRSAVCIRFKTTSTSIATGSKPHAESRVTALANLVRSDHEHSPIEAARVRSRRTEWDAAPAGGATGRRSRDQPLRPRERGIGTNKKSRPKSAVSGTATGIGLYTPVRPFLPGTGITGASISSSRSKAAAISESASVMRRTLVFIVATRFRACPFRSSSASNERLMAKAPTGSRSACMRRRIWSVLGATPRSYANSEIYWGKPAKTTGI